MIHSPQLSHAASPKIWLAFIVAITAASMGGALYFQHVLGLQPCPLCVLQRIAIIFTGVFAAIGLLVRGPRGQILASVLTAISALIGAGIAGWQSWILIYPPEALSCGRPFQWFHDDFPLSEWLPKLFRGDGDCLAVDWTLFGLAIPNLSLLAFILLLALALVALRKAWALPR